MKKIMLLGAVLLLFTSGMPAAMNASNGIGIYGNLVGNGTGTGGGLGLTLRNGSFPVIGFEWNMMTGSSVIGGSLDWWITNQQLGGIFSYYMGVGGYAARTSTGGVDVFNFGGRVPLGLQVFPFQPLEIFVEVSPMIIFIPVMDWTVSVRMGFRALWE